jgi:hypothetical protein
VSGLFLFYFVFRIGFHLKLGATGCQIVNRQSKSKVLAGRAETRSAGYWMMIESAFTPFRRDSLRPRFTAVKI